VGAGEPRSTPDGSNGAATEVPAHTGFTERKDYDDHNRGSTAGRWKAGNGMKKKHWTREVQCGTLLLRLLLLYRL
jgi:hypothetical protein